MDPKTLYEAASAVAAPDGCNLTMLEEDESYTFDESGRMVHVGYVVYKVITQKGAEAWDSFSVTWEPWHEIRPVIRARVITSDFSVHTLDSNTITEAPSREGDYKIYSDGKRLRAPIPAIAPGVVVEAEYKVSETEPLFAPGSVGRVIFGYDEIPVAHSHTTLEAPSSLALRTSTLLLQDIKPVRTESHGKVTVTYDLGPMEGLETPDPYLPHDVPHMPEVQFSTGQSWQEMASEYAKIVDSHAGPEAVLPIVRKLIDGKKTTTEKENAILDYIDREVRYTGIEFGEAAIVPHDPAVTLSHKYGDCKDKATLMVTMLRAAGIPAYVALLNAGSRMDVPADMPGMGLFDHAIVYLPQKPGSDEAGLWIDVTDRYARLGQLPVSDQGRLALIARPETNSLIKTPESTSKDNVLLELRELDLGENGPAGATEITRPTGVFEPGFRSTYADKPDKETRDALTNYVKSQYLADKLTNVERTDPTDLSRQFELTLNCEKARRGYSDLNNAVAAIRVESLFQSLPNELKQKDDSEDKKQDDKEKPRKPRTADWEMGVPFSAEWRYKIVPPAGFVPKELPSNATIPIGPAILTEEFSTDQNGAVLAHLTFDSVKRRYSADEAAKLRNKVAEIAAGSAILVNFESKGAALLHQGKVKEALAIYHSLIALHPNQAFHHLQLAKVLLEAGMGEAARAEARLAVKLEPNSALAEKTLAEILKYDLVGRELRPGSDWAGATEAYRAAIKLDPDDHATQGNLAILLEYDPMGLRDGPQAKIKDAIAEYRKLTQENLAELDIENNLAYALFYSGDSGGAITAAQALNPQPRALIVASEAMLHGSQAGLAEANKQSSSDTAFKDTALAAGNMLVKARQYPLAADFLEAGASGDNAAWAMGLAHTMRAARRHEDIHFDNTPSDVAMRFLMLTLATDQDERFVLLSRNALETLKHEDPDSKKKREERDKKNSRRLAREQNSLDVEIDIDLQRANPKVEGNDATGYRVKFQLNGTTLTNYVVKESGMYKVLDLYSGSDGLEILDRIKAGDLNGAKVLLDWLREDSHLAGGDDPLGGPIFPRFWTKGEAADAHKMKLAAAAFMEESKPLTAQGIAVLEEELKNAASDREKTNIQLALARGYSMLDNYARLLDTSSALARQFPESSQAFWWSSWALAGLGRYNEAIALSDERLKLLDGDEDALRRKMYIEADRGNYVAARAWGQKLLEQGKENAHILNSIAWYALFTGKVEQADIDDSIKSTQLSKDSPSYLHTLACLYAESGKTKEAHDLLLRAMDDLDLDGPDDNYWYAFGRIAEQYGEREIAIADYRKLAKPKLAMDIPDSSYTLAQMRLKALGADAAAPGK